MEPVVVALRSTLPSAILTVLPCTTVEIWRGWDPESRHATEAGLIPTCGPNTIVSEKSMVPVARLPVTVTDFVARVLSLPGPGRWWRRGGDGA